MVVSVCCCAVAVSWTCWDGKLLDIMCLSVCLLVWHDLARFSFVFCRVLTVITLGSIGFRGSAEWELWRRPSVGRDGARGLDGWELSWCECAVRGGVLWYSRVGVVAVVVI